MNWPLILEFSKQAERLIAAIAWPGAAAWIGYQFRQPIGEAVSRLRKVSVFGVDGELAAASAQQDAPALPAPPQNVPSAGLGLPPFDQILSEMDQGMREGLDKATADPQLKLAWAVRAASGNWLNWRHENHYRFIFGSQIQALKRLNVTGPATFEMLRVHFHAVDAAGVDPALFNAVAWITWLLTTGDVKLDPATQKYEITAMGRSFLAWMIAASATEVKAL